MIHAEVVDSGRNSDIYVVNELIHMYRKCGSMLEARDVFDSIQDPNVVHWNTLLLGYVENGEPHIALNLFSTIKERGCKPNSLTYVAALKACSSLAVNSSRKLDYLKRGTEIHMEIGLCLNLYLQTTMVDMYSKCGSMVEARLVFDSIQKPDVVSWTTLLLGYTENEQPETSLRLFTRMKASGVEPNSVAYIAALKACASMAATGTGTTRIGCLERGRRLHSEIGLHSNHNLQNTLVDLYAKCGSMSEAHRVFDSIQRPDVVSWNALLLGYVDNGDGQAALNLFLEMKKCACVADSVTYVAALRACGLIGALPLGRNVHSEIRDFTPFVVTSLVDFYAKCGSMVEACEVFELHSGARLVATWNALIAGYGRLGDTVNVVKFFVAMQQDEGLSPDGITYVSLLLCFSHAGLVETAASCFEAMSVQRRFSPSLIHYNCMVDVLGRGYQLDKAVRIVQKMPCKPDAVTWNTLLGACHRWKNVEIGRQAFQSLADMDRAVAASYVVMAEIYASMGFWKEQQLTLETRTRIFETGTKHGLGRPPTAAQHSETLSPGKIII